MAVVCQDIIGLYVAAGGYRARPHPSFKSKFKVGDKPQTRHFGGSIIAGVGKLPGRGKYEEYWMTSGIINDYGFRPEEHRLAKTERELWQWYVDHCTIDLISQGK